MPHFDFTVTLGQVLTVISFLGMGWRADRILSRYLYEHELLIQDYCERMSIDITRLPTRVRH